MYLDLDKYMVIKFNIYVLIEFDSQATSHLQQFPGLILNKSMPA